MEVKTIEVGVRCFACEYLGSFMCVCGRAPEAVCGCAPACCAGCGRDFQTLIGIDWPEEI